VRKFYFLSNGSSSRFQSDSSVHRRECFCNMQFNIKACSVQGIFKSADVVKNDPDSVACKPGSVDVMSMFPFKRMVFLLKNVS
jgi:hypothetical protein